MFRLDAAIQANYPQPLDTRSSYSTPSTNSRIWSVEYRCSIYYMRLVCWIMHWFSRLGNRLRYYRTSTGLQRNPFPCWCLWSSCWGRLILDWSLWTVCGTWCRCGRKSPYRWSSVPGVFTIYKKQPPDGAVGVLALWAVSRLFE
jgi:hypothetical protein